MMHSRRNWGRRIAAVAAVVVGLGLLAMPGPARAWWRGGVFIGAPIVVGPVYPPPVYPPPVYYPPPVVYAPPPPAVYAPPGATAPSQSAQSCYAGPYVCPLQYAMPAGANCSCYSNQGQPIPGRAGG